MSPPWVESATPDAATADAPRTTARDPPDCSTSAGGRAGTVTRDMAGAIGAPAESETVGAKERTTFGAETGEREAALSVDSETVREGWRASGATAAVICPWAWPLRVGPNERGSGRPAATERVETWVATVGAKAEDVLLALAGESCSEASPDTTGAKARTRAAPLAAVMVAGASEETVGAKALCFVVPKAGATLSPVGKVRVTAKERTGEAPFALDTCPEASPETETA